MAPLRPRVLVVEDEAAQREVLRYNLEVEGFAVRLAEDGEEALEQLREAQPDVLVLDWMLPKVSGIEVCRQVKADPRLRGIPVIMLSARGDEGDRVRGLETGADDYVVKPYSVAELLARLRTQLRRTRPASVGERLSFEDIILDAAEHRVFRGGQPVHLGPTEFRLLGTLMEKPGRVWSREQLLDRVWGQDIHVDSRTIDVHVGRLREKLEVDPGHPELIVTVWGVGYRFEGERLA